MHRHSFPTIGTHFTITIWDSISSDIFTALVHECETLCSEFDSLYSRFMPSSLITKLSTETGVCEVPSDLVAMLRMYTSINSATNGKINPCIGNTLGDLGYDAVYSLTTRDFVRATPRMSDAVRVVNDTHVELLQQTLLDLGALGKGFLIDKVYDLLGAKGFTHYLVDGSGDIRYTSPSPGVPLRCALEHPNDSSQAIGVKTITSGALCASAVDRRAWPGTAGTTLHHYIDPDTSLPTSGVLATWAYAETAAAADALASALFFADAVELQQSLTGTPLSFFSYALLEETAGTTLARKNSADFAEFFT